MLSYAQNREDVLLARALSEVEQGFYVDVGANDPVHDSVTKHFYDLGWSGINIEASPTWYTKLQEQRPKDINLNVAASDENGELTFHEIEGTGLSTSIDEFADRGAQRGFNKSSYTVEARTLNSILDEHAAGRDIHFLKIDVEGAEKSVLEGVDLQRHRPWIVVVEATEPLSSVQTHEAWDELITGRGYSFMIFDNLNRWYLADERADLKPFLCSPADEYEWVGNLWTRGYLQSELDKAQTELRRLKTVLADLSEKISI